MTFRVRQEGESVLIDGADLKRTARNLLRPLSGPNAAKATDISSAMSLLAQALGFPNLHACMESAKRALATIPGASPADPRGPAGWLRIEQDGPESLQPFGEEALQAQIAAARKEAQPIEHVAPGLIVEKARPTGPSSVLDKLQKAIHARRDAGTGIVGLVGPAGPGKTTLVASSPKAAKHEWLVVNCLDAHSVTQLDLVLRNRLRGVQCIFLDDLFHPNSLIKPSLVRQYGDNLGPTVLGVMAPDYESLRNLARSPEPAGEFLELDIVYVESGPKIIFENEVDRLRFKQAEEREAQAPMTPSRSRRRP